MVCGRSMKLTTSQKKGHSLAVECDLTQSHEHSHHWEHVPAHVNVYGNEVANGLAVEGMCSNPLWSKNIRQDSASESTVGLWGGSGLEVGELIWEELGLRPMDSEELIGCSFLLRGVPTPAHSLSKSKTPFSNPWTSNFGLYHRPLAAGTGSPSE